MAGPVVAARRRFRYVRPMPLLTLDRLAPEPELMALLARIPGRGLVLTTGQAQSGKQTVLMAIALHVAQGRPVVMAATAGTDEFAVYKPFPDHWRIH
jgi:Tfp pilus assembly pilus retraction ATPase PilT